MERNFKIFQTKGFPFLEKILPNISHKINKRGVGVRIRMSWVEKVRKKMRVILKKYSGTVL